MSVVKNRLTLLAMVLFVLLSIAIAISISISRKDQPPLIEEEPSHHILGSTDARVHVVGFFDLEAPESKAAWENISRIKEQYGDRLSIEFRHYPITAIHPHAMTAAVAAEAAGEQDKFWEFIDILWNQQDVWHAVSDPKMLFTQYAEQVGVKESARFLDDMKQQRLKVWILSDLDDARTQGVSWGTPFLVNGKPTSIDVIQLAVERVISKPQ